MKVEPVNSWVLVEPIEHADKVGSLFVVSTKDSYRQGRILAIPYALDEKVQHIMAGNVVVYDSLGSVTVRIGQGTATLVKSNEILAVVRQDESVPEPARVDPYDLPVKLGGKRL